MRKTTTSVLRVVLLSLTAAAMLGAASCSSDDDVTGPGTTTVSVTLREFSVTANPSSAPAGTITFRTTNAGTVTHELVVVRTDLAPGSLPIEVNGSYRENGTSTLVVGEAAGIAVGQSRDLTLNLSAGNYVLLCNMVIGANAHYALGMRTAFRVN